MKKLKKIWAGICRIKALKYVLTTVIAVVLIGFVDENSVWHHMQNKQKIGELQDEIDQYTDLHKRNMARIKELDADPKAIEKIARERYFMKADNEDIFVLSDDENTISAKDDETAE